MFIKKDTRKVPEILSDETDAREKLHLARREAEFLGSLEILCSQENLPKLQNLVFLSLYANKLQDITGIGTLSQTPLRELNLGHNLLTNIPAELGDIKTLREIWLEDNRLEQFPEAIFNLPRLEVLRLSNNAISSVPDFFERTPQMRVLAVDNNEISELPKSLGGLQHLEKLFARGNSILCIPHWIGQTKNLVHLQASSNQIASIPTVLGDLPRLQYCYLNSNRIQEVPKTLIRLTKLRKISLANNRIRQLPRDLEEKWFQADEDSDGTVSVELHGNPLQINDSEENSAEDVTELGAAADMNSVGHDGQIPSPVKRLKAP